jgi:hypothetical protein
VLLAASVAFSLQDAVFSLQSGNGPFPSESLSEPIVSRIVRLPLAAPPFVPAAIVGQSYHFISDAYSASFVSAFSRHPLVPSELHCDALLVDIPIQESALTPSEKLLFTRKRWGLDCLVWANASALWVRGLCTVASFTVTKVTCRCAGFPLAVAVNLTVLDAPNNGAFDQMVALLTARTRPVGDDGSSVTQTMPLVAGLAVAFSLSASMAYAWYYRRKRRLQNKIKPQLQRAAVFQQDGRDGLRRGRGTNGAGLGSAPHGEHRDDIDGVKSSSVPCPAAVMLPSPTPEWQRVRSSPSIGDEHTLKPNLEREFGLGSASLLDTAESKASNPVAEPGKQRRLRTGQTANALPPLPTPAQKGQQRARYLPFDAPRPAEGAPTPEPSAAVLLAVRC